MYTIDAGSYNGTLERLGIRAGHESKASALRALKRASGHQDLYYKPGADGEWYVYADEETRDRDDDDSAAIAVIEPEPPTTLADLLKTATWCYDEDMDTSDTRGTPPRSYDGYEMENYFELGIEAEFATREEAIHAALAAYRGPDNYGVGLDLSDLEAEIGERR